MMAEVHSPREQRAHDRYLVERHALTLLWPASSIVGRVIDISMDGLAFLYSASKMRQDGSSEIEIILAEDNFSSGALPFKTVSDAPIRGFFVAPFAKSQRRRSIQFKALTEDQKEKLAYFIDHYCWKIPD